MDALRIHKVSLCGLSMGGYIALKAIESYPERFEAMVLCDTTCLADSPEAKEKRMKGVESIIQKGVDQYADACVKNFFPQDSFTTSPDVISSVKEMIVNTSELSLCSTLLALSSRQETCTGLPDIKIPVLILVGEKDGITPPPASNFMHENIKKSSLEVINRAGHLSNLENPEEFNKHLKLFFSTVYTDHLNKRHGSDNSILRDLRNKLNMLLSFRSI
jgi:3-oxoadipate enol-lactonase